MMLKWQPEPGLMQGGTVQCENNLDFLQHDGQGKGEKQLRYTKNHMLQERSAETLKRVMPFQER